MSDLPVTLTGGSGIGAATARQSLRQGHGSRSGSLALQGSGAARG